MKIIMPAGNWVFSPGAPTVGEIDFSPYPGFVQENLYAVINTSASGNPIIFTTAGGANLGGVFASGTKLYLNFDTSSMSSGDVLQVIYDDPQATQIVGGTVDIGSMPQVQFAIDLLTGPSQSIVSDTYLDGTSFYATNMYKSFSVQIISSVSATGQMLFEGSNDLVNWQTVYVSRADSAGAPELAGVSVSPSTSVIYAGAINHVYLRARSATGFGVGVVQLFTRFYQQPLSLQVQGVQLLDNTARPITYGAGLGGGSTIRIVTSDDSQIIGKEVYFSPGSYSAVGINLMTGTSASYDVTGYKSVAMQIVGGAGITGGQVIWEGSNDNVNWNTQILIPPDNSTPSPVTSAQTIGAGVVRQLCGALPFRYYRLRISTGFTGGTVSAMFRLSPNHYTGMTIPVIGTVTAALGAGAVTGATLASAMVTDINAGNINTATTTTSAGVTNANAQCMAFSLNISVLTGTNAYQDTIIQSSNDNGATFFDIYHFPRATAAGQFNTGPIKVIGSTIRYVRITGGTGISITSTMIRTIRQVDGRLYCPFFDRTIAVNTLNSTTPSYFVEGTDEYSIIVDMGAITTTAPQFQLEGSEDNANWYTLGSPLTAVANSTVALNTGSTVPAKFIRARISTAGSGATLEYVSIKAKNI